MKRFISISMVLIMLFSMLCGMGLFSHAQEGPLWYESVAKDTALNGFFGVHAGRVSVPRAVLCYTLAKLYNANVSAYATLQADDIAGGLWYTNSCNWAIKTGLLSVGDDNNFYPNATINSDSLQAIFTQYTDTLLAAQHEAETFIYNAGDYMDYVRLVYRFLSCEDDMTRDLLENQITILTTPKYASETTSYSLDYSVKPSYEKGEVFSIAPVRSDEAAINYTYSSSNDAVLSVAYENIFVAQGEGVCTITATSEDGTHSCSHVVQVTPSTLIYKDENSVIRRTIDPAKPMIALTFDDGPGIATDKILDAMEKYNVVCTFYEQGQNVARYPEKVQRSVSLGCEEQSHTWNHPKLTTLSVEEIREQVAKTNEAFTKAIGYASTMIRPPYGARNEKVDAALNQPEILWSVDTLDWQHRNPDRIYQVIMDEAKDGDIVLMHSVHECTGEVIDRVVAALLEKGFQLVTVTELAHYKGKTLEAAHKYGSIK